MPNYTVSAASDSAVKNKLGATTHDELEKLEAKYVFARYAEIESGQGPTGNFDSAHLKAIHRHLFQDVYEWAGHTRDEKVTLSDGTVATEPLMRKPDGQLFTPGPLIAKSLDHITDELRDAHYLRGLPRAEFAERAADIMAEINSAHAFREGNGRTQRVFISEMAKEAGHDLDFTVVTRKRMTQASIAANEQGDPSMMRRLFDEISTPSRVAALTPVLEFFTRQAFPWNENYVATTEPGHAVDVTIGGTSGDHFFARATSGILIGQVADLPTPPPKRGDPCHLEPSPWPEPDRRIRHGLSPDIQHERSGIERAGVAVAKPALRVADAATGMAMSLVDFVIDFLSGSSALPPSPAAVDQVTQMQRHRQARAAIERISDSVAKGENLKPKDVRKLAPTQLENIRLRGDDYMRNLIDSLEQERKRGLEY